MLRAFAHTSADRRVPSDLPHDTERGALRRLTDWIRELLFKNAGRLAPFFRDAVQRFDAVRDLFDMSGWEHFVKGLAELEIAEPLVAPGRQINDGVEGNRKGKQIHRKKNEEFDILFGVDKAIANHTAQTSSFKKSLL